MSQIIEDLIERMQTKDRLFLSVFVALRKMLQLKYYKEAEDTINSMIDVQKQNLQEWNK
jgi:hypothetical protein